MKNLKVSLKLLVSFAIVIVLALVVGAAGFIGLISMRNDANALYYNNTVAIKALSEMRIIFNGQRNDFRAIFLDTQDPAKVKGLIDGIVATDKQMDDLFDVYEKTIEDRSLEEDYFKSKEVWLGLYAQMKASLWPLLTAGNFDEAYTTFISAGPTVIGPVTTGLTNCGENNNQWAADAIAGLESRANMLLIVLVAAILIAVAAAVGLALYISGLISKPLAALSGFMQKAGTTGDITLTPRDMENISKFSQAKDEIGETITNSCTFIRHVTNVAEELENIANGDLTTEAKLLSDTDKMGLALKKMIENLNSMFSEINVSTSQVSTGSKQIADGAQALAQGSTEQASSVEQLSSSITDIAQKTKDNADMAGRAAILANTIKGNAEKGSRQMDEMMAAVKDINAASQSISKVIKVIDDIAFQTNILALNAAVEAARAGQHGKGFAVVAEEVRSLAAKSADAANDTGNLIANSMEKAELGAKIADETAASLAEIVSGINESSKIVNEIAQSSDEQSAGIEQINKGIDQVAHVVQQNSATAEQSAAAAEQMSSQSNMLEDLVAQFKLKDSNRFSRPARSAALPASAGRRLTMPEKTAYAPDSSGEYGKY